MQEAHRRGRYLTSSIEETQTSKPTTEFFPFTFWQENFRLLFLGDDAGSTSGDPSSPVTRSLGVATAADVPFSGDGRKWVCFLSGQSTSATETRKAAAEPPFSNRCDRNPDFPFALQYVYILCKQR
ncbi:hypothetical protein MRB53_026407 [Persea americana]|uniref:Uncharacterized protein n=1 Tax=Persea americana TaxID=3435 RepID=A0ACC2LI00_PERAE|nr:hypothetical protein MRB53_026407 [Persea americana]